MSLSDRQKAPVPVIGRGPRRASSQGGAVAALPRRTLQGQAEQLDTQTRYPGYGNDALIRRDRTMWYPVEGVRGVGTAQVDWTAAGPYRPELQSRNVTVRRMAGTDQTRAFANPLDPTVGLHSNPQVRPSGNLLRYAQGGAVIQHGRTDRLSPGRYAGQSYSQTTLLQGAPGGSGPARRVKR